MESNSEKADEHASSSRIGDHQASLSPTMTFKRGEVDYRRINSSLVPFIDPEDALHQLSRSDCVLVDMRSKAEYNRFAGYFFVLC